MSGNYTGKREKKPRYTMMIKISATQKKQKTTEIYPYNN